MHVISEGSGKAARINSFVLAFVLQYLHEIAILFSHHMSRDMRFWYVRQAKPQISLRIRAVLSEPLLVAWVFYDCYATDWTSFGVSKLKRRLHRLVSVYTCQITHCWKSDVVAHCNLASSCDFVTYHMSEQRRHRPTMRSHVSSTMVDSCFHTLNNVRSQIVCFSWLIRTPTWASGKVLT